MRETGERVRACDLIRDSRRVNVAEFSVSDDAKKKKKKIAGFVLVTKRRGGYVRRMGERWNEREIRGGRRASVGPHENH